MLYLELTKEKHDHPLRSTSTFSTIQNRNKKWCQMIPYYSLMLVNVRHLKFLQQ